MSFLPFWRVLGSVWIGWCISCMLVFTGGMASNMVAGTGTKRLVNFGLYKSVLIDRRENY